jgi:predicted acetyltransferase
MQFRPITHEEVGHAAELNARAFRSDVERIRGFLEGNSRFSWRDVYGVEQDGELQAVLTAFPLDLWLGGGPVRTGAIAGVSVPPEHRRRGLAKFMMRSIHSHFRAQGIPVAILYPFSVGFYRSVGYEIAEWRHHYRVPTSSLPLSPERLRVRLARPADRPAIREVYAEYLRRRSGVQRTEAIWDERVHQREGELAVYVGETGIDGYVLYEFKRVEPGHGHEPDWWAVLVRELVALTAPAERGLLGFLAAQQEQAAAVHLVRAPDEPFGMALAEPQGHPDRRIEFIMHEVYQGSAGLLLRILDVPGAFAARRIPAHVGGELILVVNDPETPEAGLWHVQFGEGRIATRAGDPHSNPLPGGEGTTGERGSVITTDIQTLSAVYAASLTAAQAQRLGRLEGDAAALALLDAALAVPPLMVQRADWF